MIRAPQTRPTRTAEWILLIAIALIAIVFRFAQFGQTPPGLHYDEAIDAHLAQQIRSGTWPVYFEEGWGREPLYHYLVAVTLNAVPDPASALRLVSGVLGLIQLLAAYFLFRRLFGVPTALIGAAWIAVLFWTVSTSRAGLRNITLTTFSTLTALAFTYYVLPVTYHVSGVRCQVSGITHHVSRPLLGSTVAGLLLGLTFYTYQPGRVTPLIYMVFVAYLLFAHRSVIKTHWKSLAVFFGVAAVLAVPLAYFLATHPAAETGRAFQTEPIRALLAGDPGQIVETAAATLKMFTIEGAGDPQPIYNVSGRPLFVGPGALLFYLGLLVCLARGRQPAYAFMLIWLIVTLLPNMVTAPAPFFYRAIAAQTPVLALPAIASTALGDLVNRRREARDARRGSINSSHASGAGGAVIVVLAAIASLGQAAWSTRHDYFEVWGADPEVRFQYSAAHTAIARALDTSPDATPVVISGYFVEDADPYIFEQTLRRRDLAIRWFDARSALVVVAEASDQRIALPAFASLDERLAGRFLAGAQPVTRAADFTIYSFDAAAFRGEISRWGGFVQMPSGEATAFPISFDGNLALLGYERPALVSRADLTLTLLTAWRVTGEWQPSPTAIFAHLIDANGRLVAQDDRLGFPRHNWHIGDTFVQAHDIPIGDGSASLTTSLPSGEYTLQIGVYTRQGGARWTARDRAGQEIGDRVLLGQVEVQP